MRIGSLFAGVGGFDLGFERAGFETAWAVEIDEKAQAVLRLRFPKAELHDDVCAVGAHNLGPVDVVTFGSPCQDLSVAGKRAGLTGARSGLFHEATRIIRELRTSYGGPRFAVWENVPGAFSSNNGEDFACVLQEMADLGAHDVAWRVLDSRYHRVAQRRRRVFLVADLGGECAGEILSLAEGVRGDSAPRRKARKGAPAAAEAGAASRSRIDGTGGGISGAVSCKWAKGTGGPSGDEYQNLVTTETVGTLCSDTHPGAYLGQDAYTGRLVPMKAKDEVVACYDYLGSHGGGVEVGISPTLKRKDGVAVTVPVAFRIYPGQPTEGRAAELHACETDIANAVTVTEHARSTDRGTRVVCATGDITHTLDGAHGATEDGTGRGTPIVPTPRMAVRRLIPRECSKLQGFSPDWNAEGIDKSGERIAMADSSRYKQMGNAVTVSVAQAIAERIRAVLERSE